MKPAFTNARRARPLLGTFVEIAAGAASSSVAGAAIDAAFQVVSQVHDLMTFHDPASDVGRLNRDARARAVTVHPWTHAVLRTALELQHVSAGVFDVAVAPVLQRMGRLPGPPRDLGHPAGADPDGAIELLSACRVRFRRPDVCIDLGGIAKGFAVDRALQTLRERGLTRGLVNAGGDLAVFGAAAAVVSIRDPRHPPAVLCQVAVRNEALASSGGGEAAIIDPRRAAAATIRGATVRAPACVLADALTKIVIVLGEDAGPMLARYRASALFMSPRGEVHVTLDWSAGVRRAS